MSWAVAGQTAASILPGVGAYLGGREQAKAQKAANEMADAHFRENMNMQNLFGRHGIQIKALDARKAGLSPLAALGAQTFSPSPVSSGIAPVDGMANALEGMGQSLGRAAGVVGSHEERAAIAATAAQTLKMNDLSISHQELQNTKLLYEINQMVNPGVPAMPALHSNSNMPLLTGQGDSRPTGGKYVLEKPMERVHSSPGQPAQEVGTVADYGFVQTPTGLAIVPSKDVKEKIEDQLVPEAMWALRNQALPNFGLGPKPPDPKYYPPPKGSTTWVWNPLMQEFQGNNEKGAWKSMRNYFNRR